MNIERQKPHIFFPEGKQNKPTLIFPLRFPEIAVIDKTLLLDGEEEYIDSVLNNVLPGTNIDLLNQSTGQHYPAQVIFDRAKLYIDNYIHAAPLQGQIEYTAGVDVGFYNSLVTAGVISFEDGLNLVESEAICICDAFDKRAVGEKEKFIHTPLMEPFLDSLKDALAITKINRAQVSIISPTKGKIIKEPEEIRQEILSQAVNPADQKIIDKALREQGISKPMWVGKRLASKAKENPQATLTIAAILGIGALATTKIILAYFDKKNRKK